MGVFSSGTAKDVMKRGLNGNTVGKKSQAKFSIPKTPRRWLTDLGGGQA